MSVPMPDLPDFNWPVDHAACQSVDDYEPAVLERAEAMAVQALRSLTGYRVGGAARTVRPARKPGNHTYTTAPVTGPSHFAPYMYQGQWFNAVCYVSSCSCHNASVVHLPPPVGAVTEVKVDGTVLDPSAYRVDGSTLIRLDGTGWPVGQDVTKPDTEPGTFSVTYLNAAPVDGLAALAAGVLACEFAKASVDKPCSLPLGARTVARMGVTVEVPTGVFPEGMTGLPLVDQFIRYWNPNGLRQPSGVTSPDL